MADSPQWHGHDKYRDLPMLGVDPDAPLTFVPVDNGVRPDNRDPLDMVMTDEHGRDVGVRPSIGLLSDYTALSAYITPQTDGRDLMEYHRELATRTVGRVTKSGKVDIDPSLVGARGMVE